jgi:hypothetical protein
LAGVLYFAGEELRFVTWLTKLILTADFQALGLARVIDGAENELGLPREMIVRLLVIVTSTRSKFCSDGVIVTLRDK